MKCTLVRTPETLNVFFSSAYAVPPLGLCYVAAGLRKAGHDVRAIDASGEAIERLTPIDEGGDIVRRSLSDAEILDRIDPDTAVIGFGVMFSQDWLQARGLIRKARERFPRAVLVAGGEHATAEPEGVLLGSPIDYVIRGEGERAIGELLEHLEGKRALDQVSACSYRAPSGEVRHTGAVVRERDIDQIPWPAWDLIPIENYLSGGHGWGVISMSDLSARPEELAARRTSADRRGQSLLRCRPKTTSWVGVGRERVAFVARATGMPRPAKLARQTRDAR